MKSSCWYICATIVFTALGVAGPGTVARAQNPAQVLSAPPAEKYAVSPGGVDMRTGTYASQSDDLSIGSGAGDSSLTLTRILGHLVVGHDNPFGNFSSNWDIMLTQKRINLDQGTTQDQSGVDYQVSVRFGGRSQTFRAYSTIGFTVASLAGYADLTYTGDRNAGSAIYTYTAGDGTKVVFRPPSGYDCSAQVLCAYASSVLTPDGTKYTLNYENPGTPNTVRLKSVVSNRGYALLFEYGGTGNYVTKACALNLARTQVSPSGSCPGTVPATSYSYTSLNGTRLATVTDTAGGTWSFSYAGGPSGMTMGFIKPGASTPWLTNSISFGMDIDTVPIEIIGSQSFADGRNYTYNYVNSPQPKMGEPMVIAGGSFTDNIGRTSTVAYDFPIMPGTGYLERCHSPGCPWYNVPEDGSDPNYYQQTSDPATITDPLGRTTINNFCDPNGLANYPATWQNRCLVSLLQWTQDPEGGKAHFTWDLANRNVTSIRKVAKPGSGLADIVTSATYNCSYRVSCAKPTSVTDAKGNVTAYTHDPSHGGTLSEMAPAPSAGAARPLKLHTYVQKYAYILAGGSLVPAASPVWLPASLTECQTVAGSSTAACDTSAPLRITAYEYGADGTADNLLLRGQAVTADGTTLRTCYGYDWRGNKIWETSPRAGLAVCQ